MDSLNISWWATTLVGSLLIVYFYCRNKHTYWERKGVKGPAPLPFFGNILDEIFGETGENQLKWLRKHGKLFGYYMGLAPVLAVADPEVVNQLCIKDFEYFADHGLFTDQANDYQKNFIFFLKGQRWKKIRALMSPTFTSGKIKRMFKLMDNCADELLAMCQRNVDHNQGIVSLKDTYSLYTFDSISSCCYSLKIDWKGATNLDEASKVNDIVRAGLDIFAFKPFRFLLSVLIPKPLAEAINFKAFPESHMYSIVSRIKAIIGERRKSGRRVEDYLQMLIEARLSQDIELDDLDDKEAHHVGQDNKSIVESQFKMMKQISEDTKSESSKLNDIELISSASLLMLVGLETTSNLLTSTSYILAFHPEIQQTLYDEVAKLAKYENDEAEKSKNARFSYDDITCCQYLDCVISESLRYMTISAITDRQSNQDYHLEKYDIELPKGSRVVFQVHALHHDPDNWKEPEKFDPMRFMPGRREDIIPGSYVPFGIGPRHCIGMRFSLTETKLALARILIKYRMEPAPNTSFPPQFKINIGLRAPKDATVKFIER